MIILFTAFDVFMLTEFYSPLSILRDQGCMKPHLWMWYHTCPIAGIQTHLFKEQINNYDNSFH